MLVSCSEIAYGMMLLLCMRKKVALVESIPVALCFGFCECRLLLLFAGSLSCSDQLDPYGFERMLGYLFELYVCCTVQGFANPGFTVFIGNTFCVRKQRSRISMVCYYQGIWRH